MDWIIAHLPAWNSLLAIALFWMPMAFCLYAYLLRTVKEYRDDLDRREDAYNEGGHYVPMLRVGTILGRLIVSVAPVTNLFAAVFDAAPEVLGNFFAWMGRVFDQPLVPRRRP